MIVPVGELASPDAAAMVTAGADVAGDVDLRGEVRVARARHDVEGVGLCVYLEDAAAAREQVVEMAPPVVCCCCNGHKKVPADSIWASSKVPRP